VSATAAVVLVMAVAGASRGLAGPSPSATVSEAAPAALPTPPATTERDSVGSGGAQLDGVSGGATQILVGAKPDQAISGDGRWVAFVSAASSLGAGATHPLVFLHDRQAGLTTAIPWVGGGAFPAGVSAAEPTISADGSVVAFTIIVAPNVQAGGLSTGTTTPTPYVLAWDRGTNATSLVSMDSSSKPLPAWQPSISADGRIVAYTTWISPDKTPPVLSNLTADPACFSSGGTATVSVTATDPDDAVASITIVVSPSGAAAFSKPMMLGGNNTWTYVIQGSASWSAGFIDYTVTAIDHHGNSASASSTHDETGNNYLTFAPNSCIY
jgi:hypothetical protein